MEETDPGFQHIGANEVPKDEGDGVSMSLLAGTMNGLKPAKQLFGLVRAMFIDIWEMRLAEAHSAKSTLDAQIRDIESQTDALLDRIVEAGSPSVIQAYETRIDKLERQKIRLSEQAGQIIPPQGRLDEFIEHALEFLQTLGNYTKKGDSPSSEQC